MGIQLNTLVASLTRAYITFSCRDVFVIVQPIVITVILSKCHNNFATMLIMSKFLVHLNVAAQLITQTRPCNIQQYFTAIKMIIFR